MMPLAIIPVYNEADILPGVVRHLKAQGCEVHIIDNWSTDGSADAALGAGADSIERWPEVAPTVYDWTGLLKRIAQVAFERGQGRWVIFHDADEIRRGPAEVAHIPLAILLVGVAAQGYNATDFSVRTYVPIDNGFVAGSDPEDYFRHYRTDHVDNALPHVKTWLQGARLVDLHSSGGHVAEFPGRQVFPIQFTLKHYPIRSETHGLNKLWAERFPRYSPAELAKGWHVQYNEYRRGVSLLGDPAKLQKDLRSVSIVTLTCFSDIFGRFADSVDRYESTRRKIVVTSGGCHVERPGWTVVEGIEPFNFARNLNLGIGAAGTDDVLAMNDDTELTSPIVAELQAVSEASGYIGICTPKIEGDGINLRPAFASQPCSARSTLVGDYVPFVSVFLKREMIREVGSLDEGFTGYGGEDVEYGARASKLGWRSVVANQVSVKHGFGDRKYSSSFSRTMEPGERERTMAANAVRVEELTGAKA